MRPQLSDIFRVFAYGIFILSILNTSIKVTSNDEIAANEFADSSFQKLIDNSNPASIDWDNVLLSGSNSSSIFSYEKSKNNSSCHFGFVGCSPFNTTQIFVSFRIIEKLKFSSLLDQMHSIFFFF